MQGNKKIKNLETFSCPKKMILKNKTISYTYQSGFLFFFFFRYISKIIQDIKNILYKSFMITSSFNYANKILRKYFSRIFEKKNSFFNYFFKTLLMQLSRSVFIIKLWYKIFVDSSNNFRDISKKAKTCFVYEKIENFFIYLPFFLNICKVP